MEYFFQAVALMIFSHVFIGGVVVVMVALGINHLPSNATTRHTIWLSVYVIIALMPLVALLAGSLVDSVYVHVPVHQSVSIQEAPLGGSDDIAYPGGAFNSSPDPDAARGDRPFYFAQLNNWLLNNLPMSIIGKFFLTLISAGIIVQLWFFYRAYQGLQHLYRNAEVAKDSWQIQARELANDIGLSSCPLILQCESVTTPSTSGLTKPWIVFPANMLDADTPNTLVSQVMIHELAHIKRRDPLVAYLQSVVSIFLFWHPAVNWLSNKIRLEREIACDDWVIQRATESADMPVKAYATGMVDIARRVGKTGFPIQSVACVRTRHGLEQRIRLLLDKHIDHSVKPHRYHNLWITTLALIFLLFTGPIWPQFGRGETLQFGVQPLAVDPSREVPQPAGLVQRTWVDTTRSDSSRDRAEYIESVENAEDVVKIHTEPEPVKTEKIVDVLVESLPESAPEELPVDKSIQNFADNLTVEVVSVNETSVDSATSSSESDIQPNNAEQGLQADSAKVATDTASVASVASARKDMERNEYIVIDDLSRPELASEINKVQREFYRVFNASVNDRTLKVTCGSYFPTGSYIKRQYCEPQFIVDARSIGTSEYLYQTGTLQPANFIRLGYKDKFEALTQAMNDLLRTNSYFRELNYVLNELKAQLEKA